MPFTKAWRHLSLIRLFLLPKEPCRLPRCPWLLRRCLFLRHRCLRPTLPRGILLHPRQPPFLQDNSHSSKLLPLADQELLLPRSIKTRRSFLLKGESARLLRCCFCCFWCCLQGAVGCILRSSFLFVRLHRLLRARLHKRLTPNIRPPQISSLHIPLWPSKTLR